MTESSGRKVLKCGIRPRKNEPRRLSSVVLKDGKLRLSASDKQLPKSLIEANAAVESGRIQHARTLLDEQAIDAVRHMLAKDPSRSDAMLVLAMLLRQTNRMADAEQWYKNILVREPHCLVYSELGCICQCTGRFSRAIEYQQKAVEMCPHKAELQANLARSMIITGNTAQGVDLLRKAVEIEPKNAKVHSSLLFYMHYLPELDPQVLFDEHRRWALIHAPITHARTFHNNDRDGDRRLRVGYISPDFRTHPVSHFFEPLLDGHDRELVEVYGYGDVAAPDHITERIKAKFDHYRNIRGLDDEIVAEKILHDKIDILVELTGHTADNRLLLMARRPAPVQVTYLGSPDTTGLEAIDYRFTDAKADLAESQRFYSEELFFLPEGFLCYRPADVAPPLTALPAVRNGCITFGSFTGSSKIHPHIIRLWAAILKANTDSRIVLKLGVTAEPQIKENYFRRFEEFGVDSNRVAVCGYKPRDEHLALCGQVDIALDTYPFNGYTTTCEALWMGVPTISLVGRCHASRVGLSILSSVGLEFFAAATPQEYVAKANALAANRRALAQIRASMRQRMTAGTLCNPHKFARTVEAAYRKMWRRWCASVPCEKRLHSGVA